MDLEGEERGREEGRVRKGEIRGERGRRKDGGRKRERDRGKQGDIPANHDYAQQIEDIIMH